MVQTKTIRVMVIDDQDLVRCGVSAFLQTCPDLEQIGEAVTPVDALDLCATLQPDVVIMDLLNGADSPAMIRAIREQCPDSKIIVLTSVTNEEFVTATIEAGALSYLLKDISTETLEQAIRDAYFGKSTLAREAMQALVSATQRAREPEFRLTRRERQVLSLMTRGYNNGQIAEQLTISRSTAKKHVSNILAKLNTNSRTEAVAIAVQHKLESV